MLVTVAGTANEYVVPVPAMFVIAPITTFVPLTPPSTLNTDPPELVWPLAQNVTPVGFATAGVVARSDEPSNRNDGDASPKFPALVYTSMLLNVQPGGGVGAEAKPSCSSSEEPDAEARLTLARRR